MGKIESIPMILTVQRIPLWIAHFHKMAILGNGDEYRERESVVIVNISPTPGECKTFPYLKDVEEVSLIYYNKR